MEGVAQQLDGQAELTLIEASDSFVARHIGPNEQDIDEMLSTLGFGALEELISETMPQAIRLPVDMALPSAIDEAAVIAELRTLADRNGKAKSLIGQGYHGTYTPPVILRNVLENPGWYTAYTPYQAEIAQGRLEAILIFQTMICELTGMQIANASLLDEATAAAEAVTLAHAACKTNSNVILMSADLHAQTRAVIETRATHQGIVLRSMVPGNVDAIRTEKPAAIVLQYPGTSGQVCDLRAEIAAAHEVGALAIVAADLLALALLTSPGEMDADIVVGSAQRFGVPMGFGGPHAGFFALREAFKRQMPGRLVGVSQDADGAPAMRLALQTREQHIRREKATSNICTAQVLLAIIAGFYAVWHGPIGLRRIAKRVNLQARLLANAAREGGFALRHDNYFDTIVLEAGSEADALMDRALAAGFNLRRLDPSGVAIALDETVTHDDLLAIAAVVQGRLGMAPASISPELMRTGELLPQEVFSRYHSEHEMLRYLKRLEDRDIALNRSMIPLGSCTMKLNGTAGMTALSLPGFADIHPFAPPAQTEGYLELMACLSDWLCAITGFAGVSFQPNAGSQGEYAGLLAIRAHHAARGQGERNICLIPSSAHGTNPASAVMAGYHVVVVDCDKEGNVDLIDLRAKVELHATKLAALMITYPSTHGVFEEDICTICDLIHEHGGQVYMDGANMNAQVGLTSPATVGADLCHLNLHKTFCIPHGGGGPGVGPICVAEHLLPHLPTHPVRADAGPATGFGAVAAAPFGSAFILPISYAYIRLMGGAGLKRATEVAILNANYIAERLRPHFSILYSGRAGRVAHECIVDCRGFEAEAGVTVEDIAKRLQDYGYHAPTMSWPVPGTLMIEPTESESRSELDRFCDSMIAIRAEIADIAAGQLDRTDNPLKNAPHTARAVTADVWLHSYSRRRAAFPLPWIEAQKYWTPVSRVNNVYGDRTLMCTCAPLEAYKEAAA